MTDAVEADEKLSAEGWLARVVEEEHRGELLAAYDLARRGLEAFPGDVKLQHRAVLALARSGASEQAQALFGGFGLEGIGDEEIGSLAARLAKDQALAADGDARSAQADAAAGLYQATYERSGGYYPGINAATMRLFAGKTDEAAALARTVLESCESAEREAGGEDYALAATRAEAFLLLDEAEAAGNAVARATALHGGDYSAVATTRKQLRLICAAKGIDADVLAPLVSPTVVHYAGHMIAAPGVAGRFAAESEAMVAERIAAALDSRGVGYGYGSLACGADILFAEALLARDAELHVVLPFDADEFKETSVVRGGPGWVERFDACLAQAASVSHATDDSYLGDDALFSYAGRLAMGLALLRATYLDTNVRQVVVWDGEPAVGAAGTGADVTFWRSRGHRTDVIDCGLPATGDAVARSAAPAGATQQRVVRAMLFGDIKGFSKLREAEVPRFVDKVMGRFATVLDSYGEHVLYRNTWGDAIYVVLPDAATAAECALDLQAAMGDVDLEADGLPPHLALRLGGHLGPVFEGYDPVLKEPAFFGAHVSRTARIEPVTPPGQVYVTRPFAAALALESDVPFACEYVGHMPAAKDYGMLSMYMLWKRR